MDYESLFSHKFLQSFLHYYYHSPRKATVTFNSAGFFYKQAGGRILKQSVCLDVSPKNVICRRSLRCNSVRDYLLSVSSTKRGANLHLKWHIVVGLGTNRGQKRGGFFEYRNTRAVFSLFVLILRSVLSNQLYYSHWWTQQGCWNVLGFFSVSFCIFFP